MEQAAQEATQAQRQQPRTLRDNAMIAMVLKAAGWSNKDAAATVGLSPAYLSSLLASPLYQNELAKVRERLRTSLIEEVTDQLLGEAPASVKFMVDTRDDPNLPRSLRFRAAESIADRIPQTSKVHRGQPLTVQPFNLSDEQAQLIRDTFAQDHLAQDALRRAREMLGPAQDPEDLIDITPEPLGETVINDVRAAEPDPSGYDDLIGI